MKAFVRSLLERPGAVFTLLSKHWPMVLLSLFALIPLFTDLDGDHLWADEGDTAVLALNIQKYGVPKAWDGTTFLDSDRGQRVNENLVMISHPWIQYYVTAASFAFLGESVFAARFPFALAGWLTLMAVYALTLKLTSDRRAGLSASLLLLVSVQFLIYSRQCRNYALAMLVTCLLLLTFLRLRDWKTALQFAAVGVVLFHIHPAALAPLAALGVLTFVYPPLRERRAWFWRAAPLMAIFILPWMLMASAGYGINMATLTRVSEVPSRMGQFVIECASVTPLLGVLMIGVYVWVRRWREIRRDRANLPSQPPRKDKKRLMAQTREKVESLFNPGERLVLVLVGALLLAYGALMVWSLPASAMWSTGLRQVAAVLPLVAVVMGVMVSKACRSNLKVWLVLMLVLTVTKASRLSPWPVLRGPEPFFDLNRKAATHTPKSWRDSILRTGLAAFYKDLWHENPGTVSLVCDFIRNHTGPKDILVTNYDWEPIYFHTRRPLGLTIIPGYKIEKTARRHALPEYVFSVEKARWLIWRPVWNGFQGYDNETVHQMFVNRGAVLEWVTNLPETYWENRENVHFRRFPGNDHKFAWHTNIPPTQIFRVHWPKDSTKKQPLAMRE